MKLKKIFLFAALGTVIGVTLIFCGKKGGGGGSGGGGGGGGEHHDCTTDPDLPGCQEAALIFSNVELTMSAQVNDTKTQTVVVKNSSNVTATKLHFLAPLTEPLSIPPENDHCSQTDVAPNTTCTFEVLFKPTMVSDGQRVIVLSYQDANTAATKSIQVQINYHGIAEPGEPQLEFSPIPKMTTLVNTPYTQTVTVTNIGGSTANNLKLALADPLFIQNDNCTGQSISSIAPNNWCKFDIKLLSPTEISGGKQTLTLTYKNSSDLILNQDLEYDVTSQGISNFQIDGNLDDIIAFVDGYKIQTVTIINNGTSAGTIDSLQLADGLQAQQDSPPLFIQEDGCTKQTLQPKSTCTFNLKLDASTPPFTTHSIGTKSLAINGTVLQNFNYQILAPDESNLLTFTKIIKIMTATSGSLTSQVVTIQNTGSDVTGLVLLPLSSKSPLVVTENNCTTDKLSNGSSCNFTLTFNPKMTIAWAKDLIGLTYSVNTKDDRRSLTQYISYTTTTNDSAIDQTIKNKGSDDQLMLIVNNCSKSAGENLWIYFPNKTEPNNLQPIPPTPGLYTYSAPLGGEASVNIYAKLNCDGGGKNCETGDFGTGRPPFDTAFEVTWGCKPNAKCNPNPSDGSPLSPVTFFDFTMVDGYTVPMSIRTIPAENESNIACNNEDAPKLDYVTFTDCPNAENLSSASGDWDVNKNSEQHWNWDTINTNNTNHIIDSFWGSDLQKTIVSIGKANWDNGVKWLREYSNSNPSPSTSNLQCWDLKDPAKPQITIDLTKIDLRIWNPTNKDKVIGCASPKTIMMADRSWKGLGIANQCIEYQPPPAPGAPITSADPNYVNANLFYANPFSNEFLNGVGTIPSNKETNSTAWTSSWGGLLNSNWTGLLKFCQNNKDFCNDPTGEHQARPGLAALIGHAGPVSNTKYVQNIKKYAQDIYTWQYDDAAGTRVCNKRPQIILTMCPAN